LLNLNLNLSPAGVCRNQTPLHLVAAGGANGGHPEIIGALLASGARINQPDSGQQTALHKAVLTGARDDVEALLEGGADPNHVDNMGHSPVHVAAKRKTIQSSKILNLSGGNVSSQRNVRNVTE